MRHADNPRASGKQDEGNRDGSQRKQAHRSQNAPARSSATISGRVRDATRSLRTLHAPLKRRYIYRFLVPELGTFLARSSPFWVKSLVREDERKPRETSRLVRILRWERRAF